MSNPLVLKVVVDDKGNPVLQEMQGNIGKLDKATSGLGKTLTHVFTSTRMWQGIARFRVAVGDATREVFEFNKTFKQIEGVSGTSGKALDSLKMKTLEVSNATEFMASDIGKAVLELTKMGYSVEDSLKVIPHTTNLATASITDLGTATMTAIQTMKAFQLPASDIEHVVNVLHGGISQTALDFEDMAEAMKYVSPVAKTMGISLEETVSMIGTLSNAGIKGSLAGTSLKNMFLNIMKPSENVRKVLEGLNEEGLTFTKILEALKGANVPIADFLKTFDKRALAGSLVLADLNEEVATFTKQLIDNQYSAQTSAEVIRKAWIPQLENLRNTFVNTFVVMGEVLNQTDLGIQIDAITQQFVNLQEWLMKNPEVVANFAKDLAAVANSLAKILTSGLVLIVKNLDSLVNLMKVYIGLNIARNIGLSVVAFVNMEKSTKDATKAMRAFNASMGFISAMVTTLTVANEIMGSMVERAKEYQQSMNRTTFATDVSTLTQKVQAAEDYKILLDQLNIKQDQLNKLQPERYGYKQRKESLERDIDNFDKYMKESVKLLSKRYNLLPEFFTVMRTDTDMFINDLKVQLAEAKKLLDTSAGTATKVPDFTVPKGIDDGSESHKVGKTNAELTWEAYIKYLELIGDGQSEAAARVIAGWSLKTMKLLSQTGEKVGGLSYDQIKNLGALTPGFAESISNLPTGTPIQSVKNIPELNVEAEITAKLSFLNTQMTKDKEEQVKLTKKLTDADEDIIRQTEAAKDANQRVFDIEKEMADARKAYIYEQFYAYADAASMTVDTIQMIQDAQFDKMKTQHQEQLAMFDERAESELRNVENNAFKKSIVEQKLAKEKRELLKKQEDLEREQLNKRRAWSMIEAAINTAVAITRALSSVSPPANFVLAAAIAAAGAVQIGLIASQESYEKGGFTGYGRSGQPAGVVHKNEYIIPEKKVRAIGGPVEVEGLINSRLNESFNRGKSINVYIDNLIGTEEFKRDLFVSLQREAQRW